MADSDNTTSLPGVTRRRILAGTAMAVLGLPQRAYAGEHLDRDACDPTLALWRRWQDAHKATERLCRQQQSLEQKLVEIIGFPRAMVRLNNGKRVTLHSLVAVHKSLDLGQGDVSVRAEAEADFTAHLTRWDAADREIGYSTALLAERQAGDRAEELLDALCRTSASSLAGVAAKLDAILMTGQPSEGCDEFPWPQIRGVLEDVEGIARRMESGQDLEAPNR